MRPRNPEPGGFRGLLCMGSELREPEVEGGFQETRPPP
jgi:hypothetical protein